MAFVNSKNLLLSLFGAVFISSCAQIPSQPVASEPEPTAIAKESLNGESLFQLFLAEIATNRREIGAAAALYGEVSKSHNDVNAISRAAALNQAIGNYSVMQQHAERWVQLRPDDADALAALSVSLVANGQIKTAQPIIERWLAADKNADISTLLPTINNLSEEQIAQLAQALAEVQVSAPKSANLFYSRSRLEFILGQTQTALKLTKQSLKLADNAQVRLFQFQIQITLGNIEAAAKLIEPLYEQYPNDRNIAVQYARFIYQYDRENTEQLKQLHNRFATDPVIARTYARAAFEQGDFANAQPIFLRLLDQDDADEAHYFLGRIDAINESFGSAIRHFGKVKTQPFLASALAEWVGIATKADEARLIAHLQKTKAEQPDIAPTVWRLEASYFQLMHENDRALATYNSAIELFPDNIPLLYDRAMFAAQRDVYSVMENDLQAILAINPEHINALNALGYTWADQGKNLELAKEYIEKALQAEPNNPAIQDSIGWYLYRTGDLNEALSWLQKAYTQLENDEVAAHIAEVLWFLNRPEQAKTYFNEVKRLNPNSRYINKLNELFNN